jgi:hypothetical protein
MTFLLVGLDVFIGGNFKKDGCSMFDGQLFHQFFNELTNEL